MPSLVDIVTTQQTALANERDAMVLAYTQRLAEVDADLARCNALLAALSTHPQIETAVKALGKAELLPVVARDLTL
jgi:hypothetical protein